MKTSVKKLICLGLLGLLFNVAYSQQQVKSSKVLSQDEATIQKVLAGSRTAFQNRDSATFFNYFIKSPDLYYQVSTNENQLIMAEGWKAMTHMVGNYMKENPEPDKSKISTVNLKIHVNGNTAWVTDGFEGGSILSRDLLILEKQAGQWKIAALTSQQYKPNELIVVK